MYPYVQMAEMVTQSMLLLSVKVDNGCPSETLFHIQVSVSQQTTCVCMLLWLYCDVHHVRLTEYTLAL